MILSNKFEQFYKHGSNLFHMHEHLDGKNVKSYCYKLFKPVNFMVGILCSIKSFRVNVSKKCPPLHAMMQTNRHCNSCNDAIRLFTHWSTSLQVISVWLQNKPTANIANITFMFRLGLGTTLGTLTEQGLDLWLSLTIGVFVLFAIFACLLYLSRHQPLYAKQRKWMPTIMFGVIHKVGTHGGEGGLSKRVC